MEEFTQNVVTIIKNIPPGRVISYGAVGAMAGAPRSARQVVRVLRTQTKKHDLPWFRVVNARLQVAIKDPLGQSEQIQRLKEEGISVDQKGRIPKEYLWSP